MISKTMVTEANERINIDIKTPLEKSLYLSSEDKNIYLKLECQQPVVKSFKIRGVMSKLTAMTDEEKKRGVTAVSSGNHGAALSYGAYLTGIKAVVIYVPNNTPASKTDKMEYFGAKIVKIGDNYDQAHEYAEKKIAESGYIEINPCEDPILVAGHGTAALEMLRQNPDIDEILVPIGGGGLISGISIYAKSINPNIRIIGVQPEANPSMLESMRDNICYEYYEGQPSICEALIGGVSRLGFKLSKELIDDVILVDEKTVWESVRLMALKEKVIAEPSSALCYGAVMKHSDKLKGNNTALVISGGNISEDLFLDIMKEVQ